MVLDIIKRDLIYYEEYHYFCLRNCIRQILEYYGVQNALFFVSSYPDTVFVENDNYNYQFKIVNNNSNQPVLPEFLSKISLYQTQSESTQEVWRINKRLINEGLPVIIGVDTYHLNYKAEYGRTHGAHAIILCGYSNDERDLYIVDWYKPNFYKGTISFEDFTKARSSNNPFDLNPFSGFRMNNSWLEIKKDDWRTKSEYLVYSTICNTISNSYSFKVNSKERIYCGTKCFKKVYQKLKSFSNESADIKSGLLKYLHENMYITSITKRLFYFYLYQASLINNMVDLSDLVSLVSDLVQKWNSILFFILKASVSKTNESYNKILYDFNVIYYLEEELIEKLYVLKERLEVFN